MKFVKIFFINFIIIVILLVIFDSILFEHEKKKYLYECSHSAGIFNPNDVTHFVPEVRESNVYIEKNRSIVSNKINNKSIMLLGCSYTYGTGLEENQTFAYYLAKETEKNIYNLGIQGGSPYNLLYLIQQQNFKNEYQNVNLIIYTYIGDHINRLNQYLKCEIFGPYCNLRLVKSKKSGKYIKASEWYRYPSQIFLFRMLLKYITDYKNQAKFYDKNTTEFANIINEINKNMKNYYPNSKFVFLVYYPEDKQEWMFDKLDNDIKIISTDEITNVNLSDKIYTHDEDPHPSEKAWQEIVPNLVSYLMQNQYLK